VVKAATARRNVEATDHLAADVGQRIRAARQEQGLSLAEVGGEDLSRSFLSLVELGRSRISLQALSIVARRLNLPVSYFLDGSADSAGLAAELALDHAEQALSQQQPHQALQTLASPDALGATGARLLFLRGWALLDAQQGREAIPVLQEGVNQAEQTSDWRQLVQTLYLLARTHYELGQPDEALFQARRAVHEDLEHLDDPVLRGKITVGLGHILYVQGHHDEALAHYARARELFGTLNDPRNLAAVYAGLSRVYQHQGDLSQAVRYSRMSVAIYGSRQSVHDAAQELANMAARYADSDHLEEAVQYAREAVEQAQNVRAVAVEAMARSTLAQILLQQGDAAAAEQEAQAALLLSGEDVTLGQIDAWLVLARAAEIRADYATSDDFYVRALTELQARSNTTQYADAALAYGLALRARGDLEQAFTYTLLAAQAKAARRP